MIAVSAPSKINLSLNVLSALPDGYHAIDTVFYPLNTPSDRVALEFPPDRQSGTVIRCKDPDVPADPRKNLCGRAVEAFFRAAGILHPPAVDVLLEKNIPCAGGMGGGSSDAAAVLLILNGEFRKLSQEVLAETARSLGADVPFFLNPVPSRARGIGEQLAALPDPPCDLPLVLAAPDFPVSAKWAYDRWTPEAALPAGNEDRLAEALKNHDLSRAAAFMKNSLSAPLFRKFPVLQWMRESFLDSGALCAEVSGSGPTMFALYPDAHAADSGCRIMTDAFPSVRIFRGA